MCLQWNCQVTSGVMRSRECLTDLIDWVEKVNGGQNICNRSRVASVGNGKNFDKQAQSSKG